VGAGRIPTRYFRHSNWLRIYWVNRSCIRNSKTNSGKLQSLSLRFGGAEEKWVARVATKRAEIGWTELYVYGYSGDRTFMILHWATPVTVSGTPWEVSTFSHIGLRVITLRESRCTSVTSHHAHAQPPTIVRFLVDPQQPPGKGVRNKDIIVL